MSIVLIFIDGLGIGDSNPATNPCVQFKLKHLNNYFYQGQLVTSNSGCVIPLDANLSIEGLPQSATGQTAILTGVNASQHLGRHLQGFPNQSLREILKEHALPVLLKDRGLRPVFINAYRSEFFRLPEKIQWRMSATTIANLAAELPFMTLVDIKQNNALYHDFTNHYLIKNGYDVPRFSPEHAGAVLAQASYKYDFVLYEYFMTDRIGHHQNLEMAQNEIQKLDQFLSSFLQHVDLENTITILTSDHGNIEDLSVKTHTRNPAMTILWGANSKTMASALKSIADIALIILQIFRELHA